MFGLGLPELLLNLAAFILAAFITPTPDIITQSLLALPMVVLYEVSLVLCKILLVDV